MKKFRHYGMILTAACLWGSAGLFVNLLADAGIDNREILFCRAWVSAGAMAVWIALTDKRLFRLREKKDLLIFGGQGILGYACSNLCYYACIRSCSMGAACALLYLAPAFVMVLSVPLFKERLTARKLIAVLGVVAGAFCTAGVLGGGQYPLSGVILGVLAGFLYGFYSIFARMAVGRYHALTANFYAFGLAGIFAGFLQPWCQLLGHVSDPGTLGGLVLSALFCCTLPYLLYTVALRTVPATVGTVVSALEPAMAALIGFALYDETLGAEKLMGIGLIVAAVAVSTGEKNAEE